MRTLSILTLALLVSQTALFAFQKPMNTIVFESCTATWDGARLTLANRFIERQWQWKEGRLFATSFRDLGPLPDEKASMEWLAQTPGLPSPVPKTSAPATPSGELKFSAKSGAANAVQAPSLSVELASTSGIVYRFQIFPQARGILMQTVERAGGSTEVVLSETQSPSGIETPASPESSRSGKTPQPSFDVLEAFTLVPEHLRLTQVTLLDQTDTHNQLVFEKEWLLHPRNEAALHLQGNLFFIEDTLTHSGLIFLKLAPLPHARPVKNEWDLESAPKGRAIQFTLVGNGLDASGGAGYQYVTLSYRGGHAGRTEALQIFQRQLRPYVAGRDGMFLSNTWGDRSRDARINADFMQREISSGSALGVDVIQIDDGWQTGRTANSSRGPGVWSGYWNQNPNFWKVDRSRFPQGLAPLVKQAAAKGVRFGLWFGPDSSSDFSNWKRDADRLLELHRVDGIDYFKVDSVKAVTKAGEQNLRRLFDRVQTESRGKVVFDLDVTAEIRPGYFGMIDVGPLFLENRYTDFHGYWPHQTLRNLWQLASYVDPLRLRLEVLNNERSQKLYGGDPLAPSIYKADYLFATVMFANPLGWFEMSNLSLGYTAPFSKLVENWKLHRNSLFAKTILPFGDAPDGTNWSGFAAFDTNREFGYVLLFRGVGAAAEWTGQMGAFGTGKHVARVLGGGGTVVLDQGTLRVTIPATPGFVWAEVQ